MRRRRALIGLGTGLLILGGCASSDTSSGSAVQSATGTVAVSTPPNATTASESTASQTDGTTAAPSGTEAASGDDDITPPSPGAASGESCSSDGSPTDLSPLDGDVPDVPVDPEFEKSPLPSVNLRRINCSPAFVNLKNEAPGELPVLYWFWAPF